MDECKSCCASSSWLTVETASCGTAGQKGGNLAVIIHPTNFEILVPVFRHTGVVGTQISTFASLEVYHEILGRAERYSTIEYLRSCINSDVRDK